MQIITPPPPPPSEVQFTLQLGGSEHGNPLNSFDEGVELAFQHINGNGEWIPLMFYTTKSMREDRIRVGTCHQGWSTSEVIMSHI